MVYCDVSAKLINIKIMKRFSGYCWLAVSPVLDTTMYYRLLGTVFNTTRKVSKYISKSYSETKLTIRRALRLPLPNENSFSSLPMRMPFKAPLFRSHPLSTALSPQKINHETNTPTPVYLRKTNRKKYR